MTLFGDADLSTRIDGAGAAVTVSESVAVTVAPPAGAEPVAVAVLLIAPRSTSAWVTTYVAVQVVDKSGASVASGHDTAERPGNGSLTPALERVTLPVFVTKNE